ncbi:MAG: HlyD family efflux transporter periplasmic adaptor subunit [Eubacteriales bacterium]|nr:HlyD family efflux transporter periplasmic adaptor subunit [Eubacteriales bacterium]
MVNNKKNKNKILKLRKQFKPNVGILFFLIIVVYIVFAFISYQKREKVMVFEVEEGNIVKEHNYTGLIFREEVVKKAELTGYVNFYLPEGKKAAKYDKICSIDESGNLKNYIKSNSSEFNELSNSNLAEIRNYLNGFSRQFDNNSFNMTYDADMSLESLVMDFSNRNVLLGMSDKLKAAGINFNEFSANQTGMVSYSIDGYEGLKIDDIEESWLDKTNYKKTVIHSGDHVNEGDDLYKIITSDKWQIVFKLDENDLAEFGDKKSLVVQFGDKDLSTTGDFHSIRGKDGNSYGVLEFSKYLTQFNAERFTNFEIVSNDVSGLKIPEKSITKKDFCIIPKEYLFTNDDGEQGFYKENLSETGTSTQFISTDIYNEDEEYCYIECNDNTELKVGDYITKPQSTDKRYQIGPVKPLEGVYNVNKGYTVFKRIEPLEMANGYCIIKKNTSYGLSVYDHIVLDASTVSDGQLIFR